MCKRKQYEETDLPLGQGEFFSLQAYKQAYKEYMREPQDDEDDDFDYMRRAGFRFFKSLSELETIGYQWQ